MTPKRQQTNRPHRSDQQTQRSVNVLMAGVGGQGVLIGSETLALAAMAAGLEAKQSEVHGVAQRGGSVVSHVRFGRRVFSPLIRCGDVDVLYAMERLEALRYAHYVKPACPVIMSDHAIKPITLPDEPDRSYPDEIPGFLRGKGYDVHVVPALQTAIELGDKRCANVVLLGVLSSFLALDEQFWQAAMERRFPKRVLQLNKKAFAKGRELLAAA